MRFLALAVFIALVPPGVAGAQTAAPTQTPAASPSPQTVDPKIAAMAKDWLDRVQANNIDRSALTDQANSAFTPALVQQVSAQLAPLGKPTTFEYMGSQAVQGMMAYRFEATFASQTKLDEILVIDSSGKIAGLRFTPASP